MAVPQLALIAAFQNDSTRAATLDTEVEKFALTNAPVVVLARAVWHARSGRWPELLQTLDMNHVRPLWGSSRALADALRAWALVNTGQPKPPIDLVGVFGETGPDALRQWWPEFAAFLERTPAAE